MCAGLGAVWALARASALPALAGSGQPSPRQIGFQEAVTPVAARHPLGPRLRQHHHLPDHGVRAGAHALRHVALQREAQPDAVAHHAQHAVEVLWTVIPVLILVAIAIPSFKLLYYQYTFPPPDLTIKAIGHAWNWTHEFPDQGISVDSVMLQDDEREDAGQGRHPGLAGAAQSGGRQRDPGARQQSGARARHLERRDPQLDHPLVRLQGRRRARPRHGHVVQGRRRKASTSASARSCAARTTPSCRSPCAS